MASEVWSMEPPEEPGYYYAREAVSKRWVIIHTDDPMALRADEWGAAAPPPEALAAMEECVAICRDMLPNFCNVEGKPSCPRGEDIAAALARLDAAQEKKQRNAQ